MSFPDNQGAPWYIWANGFPLQLTVTTIRDNGSVAGLISDGVNPDVPILDGTWDDQTKKFQFKLTIGDTGEVQSYTGFFFDQLTNFAGSPLNPQGNPQNYWVFAGSFTSTGGFEDPIRAASGWGWLAVTL